MNASKLTALLLLTLLPSSTYAGQSAIVLSNQTDARDCYRNAQRVIKKPETATLWSETSCDLALAQDLLKRDVAALHINRGIIRASHENYQAAFSDYKKALELNPRLAEAYVNIGNLYFYGNNLSKALEFYTEALQLGIDRSFVVYLNRGMVLENMGNYPKAKEDYLQSLKLKPEWSLPAEKLARLKTKLVPEDL